MKTDPCLGSQGTSYRRRAGATGMAEEVVEVEQARRRRAEEGLRAGGGWRVEGAELSSAGPARGVQGKQNGYWGRSSQSHCLDHCEQLGEHCCCWKPLLLPFWTCTQEDRRYNSWTNRTPLKWRRASVSLGVRVSQCSKHHAGAKPIVTHWMKTSNSGVFFFS